jgi:hypothetical protein
MNAWDMGDVVESALSNAPTVKTEGMDYLQNGRAEVFIRDEDTKKVFIVCVREIGA